MGSVSFIIPCLNEEKFLALCLRSVRALELPAGMGAPQLIVVDNRSKDRSAAVAAEHGATVLQIDPGKVSRARNLGARHAAGELLAFIDADCELDPRWLVRCAAPLQDTGVVSTGTVMSEPPPPPASTWVERAWYELAHRRRESAAIDVPWLATFNLLVRRDAFEAVGGFDEA